MVEAPSAADLTHSLDSMQEWVSRYDNKSSILLGINIAMLAFLANAAPPAMDWTSTAARHGTFAGLGLIAAIVGLLWSNLPRTKPPRRSLHFFGTIATMNEDEFVRAATSQSAAERDDDVARQVHRIAVILRTKFRALQFSYWATLVSLVPWAGALLAFRLGG